MSVIEAPAEIEVELPKPTTADVLDRAAYLFEEEIFGWCQFSFGDSDRTPGTDVCASSALEIAVRDLGLGMDAWLRAYDVLSDLVDAPVSTWNDRPNRTKREVIATLDEAARITRQEPGA